MPDEKPRSLLHRLVELPVIGEVIGSLVVFSPFFVVGLVNAALGGPLNSTMDSMSNGAGLILMGIMLAPWLLFLENQTGLRFVLPILRVPWIWLTALFVGVGILGLLGIVSL